MKKPTYVLFAGINGAGKSTLFETYKDDFPVLSRTIQRVNPDEILRNFGGNPENKQDQAKSAKIAVKNLKSYMTNLVSFNQETTLGGNAGMIFQRNW